MERERERERDRKKERGKKIPFKDVKCPLIDFNVTDFDTFLHQF